MRFDIENQIFYEYHLDNKKFKFHNVAELFILLAYAKNDSILVRLYLIQLENVSCHVN